MRPFGAEAGLNQAQHRRWADWPMRDASVPLRRSRADELTHKHSCCQSPPMHRSPALVALLVVVVLAAVAHAAHVLDAHRLAQYDRYGLNGLARVCVAVLEKNELALAMPRALRSVGSMRICMSPRVSHIFCFSLHLSHFVASLASPSSAAFFFLFFFRIFAATAPPSARGAPCSITLPPRSSGRRPAAARRSTCSVKWQSCALQS